MLCNTLWSDRCRLITKKHFLPIRVLINVGIDPNFPQKSFFFPFLALFREKLTNGSSKTLGLAKLQSNFTGLAVSFFERLCASCRFVFYTKVSRSLDFLQFLRVSKSRFVDLYLFKMTSSRHLILNFSNATFNFQEKIHPNSS